MHQMHLFHVVTSAWLSLTKFVMPDALRRHRRIYLADQWLVTFLLPIGRTLRISGRCREFGNPVLHVLCRIAYC
jgi:hypothetical protein